VIDLPEEVKTEATTATLKDGLLELKLPRSAESTKDKAVRVEVKAV